MIVLNKTSGNVEPTDHRGQASQQQQHRHLSGSSFLVGPTAGDESSGSSGDHNDLAVVVCNELDGSRAAAMATSMPVSMMAAPETAPLAASGCTMMVVGESILPRASTVDNGSNGNSTHHNANGRRKKAATRPKQSNGSGARKLGLTAATIAAAGNTVANKVQPSALEEQKAGKIQAESVGCRSDNLGAKSQRRQRQRQQQRQQQSQQSIPQLQQQQLQNADERQIGEDLNIRELTDSVAAENHHRCLAIDGGSPTAIAARSSGDDSPDSRSNSSATYSKGGSPPSSGMAISVQSMSSTSSGGSFSSQATDGELGNKCGKCQNHEIEISKKGHARDCPFKKCNCLKCRLLDARSDILQVISGKETKLKGTKKDPNCGFCQNHGVKILRKGHVRSCGFGQERHFKQDNCFDCEVHYIRNEVNRLQIKMRRAMKEDRTLSEEQRKTAREAITRDEVEKVCDMARLARKKRENILMQQAGESSTQSMQTTIQHSSASPSSSSISNGGGSGGVGGSTNAAGGCVAGVLLATPKIEPNSPDDVTNVNSQHTHQLNQMARQPSDVWRPWSQQQVAAAMAAQQQHHHHHHQQQHHQRQPHQQQLQLQLQLQQQQQQQQQQQGHNRRQHQIQQQASSRGQAVAILQQHQQQQQQQHHQQLSAAGCGNDESNGVVSTANNQQQQLTNTITSMAMAANHTYLLNSLQAAQQQQQRRIMLSQQLQYENAPNASNGDNNNLSNHNNHNGNNNANLAQQQLSPSSTPPDLAETNSNNHNNNNNTDQPLYLNQRNLQEQQLFNTLFRLIVAQFAQPPVRQAPR